MRQRSNIIVVLGIAFLLVGGAIVWLIVRDDGGSSTSFSGSDTPTRAVVVAKDRIPANTLGSDAIAGGMIELEEVPSATVSGGMLTAVDDLDEKIFRLEVPRGSRISTAHVTSRSVAGIPVPEGFDGVAITVASDNGGAGYIAPGDTVNLYAIFDGPTSDEDAGFLAAAEGAPRATPRTELSLTNVLVLDVDRQEAGSLQAAAQTGSEDDTSVRRGASSQPITYFLALRPTDVERAVHLSTFAEIYLAKTADDAPPAGDTPGVDGSNVNAPVSADSAAKQD